MAMSYTQRKSAVIKGLRRVRQSYRRADSQGEQLERELDRLILRKTLIGPESLRGLVDRYRAFAEAVRSVEGPTADAVTIASV